MRDMKGEGTKYLSAQITIICSEEFSIRRHIKCLNISKKYMYVMGQPRMYIPDIKTTCHERLCLFNTY